MLWTHLVTISRPRIYIQQKYYRENDSVYLVQLDSVEKITLTGNCPMPVILPVILNICPSNAPVTILLPA